MFDVLWLPVPEDLMRVPDPWPDKEGEPEHEDDQEENDQLGNTINATHDDDDRKDDDVESMGQFNDSGMGSETTRHALIEYVHPTNALTCVTELTPDERFQLAENELDAVAHDLQSQSIRRIQVKSISRRAVNDNTMTSAKATYADMCNADQTLTPT